jgi:signal transduction histidine kinase
VEYFQPIASLKNLKLKSDIEDNIFYEFNSTEFKRLIDNNISNALKYSYENGTVKVSLKIENDFIELAIIDNGVGIKDTQKVLDRYYSENSTKGGFGIGLNIVKSVANKYGITIEIESKLKKGTIFIYKIPFEKS